MDPATVERLQALQMADLGTARREYISTADNKYYDGIRLEDIEAARLSNVQGSEARRLAEANKERLTEWSNMHKKVGDADDLEQLDDLMHGQSHRAELSAKVQSAGGQTYSKVTKKNDNFLKLSHTKSLRVAESSGRGGGVIGTRGRASQSIITRSVSHQSLSMLGHHVAPNTRSRSRLDPAREDLTEASSKKNRFQNKTQQEKRNDYNKPKPHPIPRPKREPLGVDFSRVLSNPSDFLSVARSMHQTRAPSATPNRPVQDPGSRPSHTTPLGDHSNPQEGVQKPTPTHELLFASASREKANTSVRDRNTKLTPITVGKGDFTTPRSTRPALRSSPGSRTIGLATYTMESHAKSMGVAAPNPQTPKVQDLTPKRDENAKQDLLVDVSGSSSSTDRSLTARLNRMTLMSPGIEDLRGLVFEQDTPSFTSSQGPTSLLPESSYPRRKIDFEQYVTDDKGKARQDTEGETSQRYQVAPSGHGVLEVNIHVQQHLADRNEMRPRHMRHESQKSILPPPGLTPPKHKIDFNQYLTEKEETETKSVTVEAPSSAPSNPLVEVYRRELAALKDFIKSMSPDSFTVRSVKTVIQELEAKIDNALHESSNIPSTNVKEHHRGARRESSSTPKSPSSLRTTVTVLPFVPGRRPSLINYRSHDSISSNSIGVYQSTSASDHIVATTRHDTSTSTHIIGDHLLPGHQLSGLKSIISPSTSTKTPKLASPSSAPSKLRAPSSVRIIGPGPGPTDYLLAPKVESSNGLMQESSSARTKTQGTTATKSAENAPSSAQQSKHAPSNTENATAKSARNVSSTLQQSRYASSNAGDSDTSKPGRAVSASIHQSKYAPENYKLF